MNLEETIVVVEQQHQKAKDQAEALWNEREDADKAWLEASNRAGRLLTCLETLKTIAATQPQ